MYTNDCALRTRDDAPRSRDRALRSRARLLCLAGALVTGACSAGGGGSAPAGTGGAGGRNDGGGAGGGPIAQTCVPPLSRDNPVAKLSQTGCVDPAHPTVMAASVIPYEVNSPLWSDGADKTRGMALPNSGKVHVKDCAREPAACPQGPADTGKWVFPVGTVMVKSFLFDDKLLETRLFVRFDQTEWIGYTYRWDEGQTDATLVPDDRLTVSFNTGKRQVDWHYPNRIDCTKCHDRSAGWTLGPETVQMNRVVGGVNQIDRLQALDVFDAPVPKPYQAPLIAPYPSQAGTPPASSTIEERARSYLHANCAICHRPDGEFGDLDLRKDIPFKDMHICNVAPARGDLVVDNLVLAPGDPQKSVTWIRMNTPPDLGGGKTNRMPQVASYVIDSAGLQLVGDWIRSITACP